MFGKIESWLALTQIPACLLDETKFEHTTFVFQFIFVKINLMSNHL